MGFLAASIIKSEDKKWGVLGIAAPSPDRQPVTSPPVLRCAQVLLRCCSAVCASVAAVCLVFSLEKGTNHHLSPRFPSLMHTTSLPDAQHRHRLCRSFFVVASSFCAPAFFFLPSRCVTSTPHTLALFRLRLIRLPSPLAHHNPHLAPFPSIRHLDLVARARSNFLPTRLFPNHSSSCVSSSNRQIR